jgi:hypothetical protein
VRVKGVTRSHVTYRDWDAAIAEIDAMAAARGVNRSEMVRRLIRAGLTVYRRPSRQLKRVEVPSAGGDAGGTSPSV